MDRTLNRLNIKLNKSSRHKKVVYIFVDGYKLKNRTTYSIADIKQEYIMLYTVKSKIYN